MKRIPWVVHAIPPLFFVLAAILWFLGVQVQWQESVGATFAYPFRMPAFILAVGAVVVICLDLAIWFENESERNASLLGYRRAVAGRPRPLPRRKP